MRKLKPTKKKDRSPTVHRDGTVSFFNFVEEWERKNINDLSMAELHTFDTRTVKRIARVAQKDPDSFYDILRTLEYYANSLDPEPHTSCVSYETRFRWTGSKWEYTTEEWRVDECDEETEHLIETWEGIIPREWLKDLDDPRDAPESTLIRHYTYRTTAPIGVVTIDRGKKSNAISQRGSRKE